jgi:hypothetical protein
MPLGPSAREGGWLGAGEGSEVADGSCMVLGLDVSVLAEG